MNKKRTSTRMCRIPLQPFHQETHGAGPFPVEIPNPEWSKYVAAKICGACGESCGLKTQPQADLSWLMQLDQTQNEYRVASPRQSPIGSRSQGESLATVDSTHRQLHQQVKKEGWYPDPSPCYLSTLPSMAVQPYRF